jgi:hypothetical protein
MRLTGLTGSGKTCLDRRHTPAMRTTAHTRIRPEIVDDRVVGWRREQLRASGFPSRLAGALARDPRCDLHALLELVERGCEPTLAARILAPLDEDGLDCHPTREEGT